MSINIIVFKSYHSTSTIASGL